MPLQQRETEKAVSLLIVDLRDVSLSYRGSRAGSLRSTF
jgi:hypothetical protein